MSDKFKQFKNDLIDLCEKYNVELWVDAFYEIEVCEEETQRSLGVIEDGLSKKHTKRGGYIIGYEDYL